MGQEMTVMGQERLVWVKRNLIWAKREKEKDGGPILNSFIILMYDKLQN